MATAGHMAEHLTFKANQEQPGGPSTPVGDQANQLKVSTFRNRKLTKEHLVHEATGETVDAKQGRTPPTLRSPRLGSRGRLRSRELDDKASVQMEAPVFPAGTVERRVLGTYSCRGLEPSSSGKAEAKINQDVGSVCYPFGGRDDQALLCVLDGHGTDGELVSACAMDALIEHLEQNAELNEAPGQALADSFEAAQAALLRGMEAGTMESTGDPLNSGATALVVLLRGHRELWVACAGDCRAVVGVAVHDEAGQLEPRKVEALDLNDEHKPGLEAELQRITAKGGHVRPAYKDEDGFERPARLYSGPTARGPGLALSRSLGDVLAQSCGLTHSAQVEHVVMAAASPDARPDAPPRLVGVGDMVGDGDGGRSERSSERSSERRLEMRAADDCLFLLMGSDGLWELMTSQQAADEVLEHYRQGRSAGEACERLISIATAAWKAEEGDYRDDITCIVLYLPCFTRAEDAPDAAAHQAGAAAAAAKPASAPAPTAAAVPPSPATAATGGAELPAVAGPAPVAPMSAAAEPVEGIERPLQSAEVAVKEGMQPPPVQTKGAKSSVCVLL